MHRARELTRRLPADSRRRQRSGLAAALLAAGLLANGLAAGETPTEPLQTLFHLSFDAGFAAQTAQGERAPTNANRPELVAGLVGQAARFGPQTVLRYLTAGIFSSDRGAVSFWLRPARDFLSPSWKYIFSLDSGEVPGEKPLCLWSVGGSGLRYDVRDRPKMDSLTRVNGCTNWTAAEWHHVVCAWDTRGQIAVFVDGEPSSGFGSDSKKCFIPLAPYEIAPQEALLFGAFRADGNLNWGGDIDEVKLFNRPLTLAEARAEFTAQPGWSVQTRLLDRYFSTGATAACRIDFTNFGQTARTVTPTAVIADPEGAELTRTALAPLKLEPGARQRAEFALALPKPGPYALKIAFAPEDALQPRQYPLAAVAERESAAGDGQRELVAELDAAQVAPLAESAASQVVDSPLGRYREAGRNGNDRFALEFSVKAPHTPHVAEFEIPDDRRRTVEVLYQALGRADYQGQGGIFTGDEYPCTGRLIRHTLTFWPLTEQNAFIFRTGETGAPAAVKSVRIYRLPSGFKPLTIKPFVGSVPARRLGMYFEDPVLPLDFGLDRDDSQSMANFPGFATTADRLLDYLQSFGQDLLRYPVAWYGGPLYGQSEAEPLAMATRPHPQDFPAYLLKRMQARGMKFNGWLHVHQLASLNPYCLLDEARVAAGEETVINMRGDNHLFYTGWHHKDPAYNPLDPRVQTAVKNLIAEILDRYGREPALEGLTLNVVECSLFAFGSIESGYNDCNLRAFQEETGIKLPVAANDPQRFAQSHDWLLANARAEWVDWRCRKIHRYYRELADMLVAARPDLKLGVSLYQYPVNYSAGLDNADYLRAGHDPNQWYREQGVDAALFADDANIVLIRHADMRLRATRASRGNPLDAENLRTASLAPEMVRAFAQLPGAELNLHDVYWENAIGRKKPLALPAGAHECGWRVAQLNANTFHALEQYAAGVNNFDALAIAKGGFVVGLNGMEPYLAEFAPAFRALPAVKFADVPELADPVRVRQQAVDGHNYFYVLNRLPYPVEAEIQLSGGEAEDLVSGEKSAGGRLSLKLPPYALRSFRQADAQGRVTGGTATAPAELIAELQKQVETAAATFTKLSGQGIDLAEVQPYLEKAQACRAEKQYARLYFLLQESWLPKMKRLTDKNLQSLLNQPADYLEKTVYAARTLTAVRAVAAPQIDGELDEADWRRAPVCAELSDFLTFRGRLMAKPADPGLRIRLLYDDRALYVGVECADPQPAQILVKPGLRDGALWSDDDAVEIFLRSPAMGPTGHAQLAVNAGGSRTDLFAGNLSWNGEWQAASRVTAAGWQTEVAVPFATLGEGLTAGSGWTFNLVRTRRDAPKSGLVGDADQEWKCEARFPPIRLEALQAAVKPATT